MRYSIAVYSAVVALLSMLSVARAQDAASLVEKCHTEATDDGAHEQCDLDEYKRDDAELQQHYQAGVAAISTKAVAIKPDDTKLVQMLRERLRQLESSQLTWQHYRDDHCQIFRAFTSGTLNHGFYECHIRVTLERIKELDRVKDFTQY